MGTPASRTRKPGLGMRTAALLALVGLFSMFLAPVLSVRADDIVNNVTVGGNDTITAGGSTTVSYTVIEVNDGQLDSDGTKGSKCNVTDGTTGKLTITVPAGVTASATVLTFTACGVPQSVTFGSSTVGNHPVTVSMSDAGGDYYVNQANFTLNVNAAAPPPPPADTTAPVLTLPGNISTPATSANGAVVTYTATATDAVDGSRPVTCSPVSGSTFALGTTEVFCIATDTADNTASGSFTVTVTPLPDTTAPVLTMPANQTLEATSGAGAAATFTVTATDNTDPNPIVSCSPASGSTFPLGATAVSCSATDAAGNTANGSFKITVQDTTAPKLSLPNNTTRGATDATGKVVNYANEDSAPTASDLVDGSVTVSCSPDSGSLFPLGITTVECSAKDKVGNTATDPFTITVVDKDAPVLTLPGNTTREATESGGKVVNYASDSAPIAVDNVDGLIPVSCTPASGTLFPFGETTVTCSATDKAGHTATGSFTITVRDTTGPEIIVPANVKTEATGANGAKVSFEASARDKVDGPVDVTCKSASGLTSGSTFPLGETTVTCSAIDSRNNTSSASFNVIVEDTKAPVLALSDITEEATGATGAVVTFSPTATDAVDGAVAVSCLIVSGSTFALGTTTVTCSATDKAGNTGTGSFKVTVKDTTAPEVTVPANIIKEATSANGAQVSYSGQSATDAVTADPAVTCTPASDSTFALGITTVTCTAKDAAGNTGTKTFSVKVVDTTKPALLGMPEDITAEATDPNGAAVTFSAPTASDLVDGSVAVTCSKASGSTFALSTTTVDCSATDAAGNKATGSFTVKVQDTTAPALTVPTADVVAEATGSAGAVVNSFAVLAQDTVDANPVVSCLPAAGGTFALGITKVSCTATDAAGNTSASQSFNVVVQDTKAPVISGTPANMTVEATSANGAAVTFTAPTASDLVDGAIAVSCDAVSGSVFKLGTTTVECSATDKAGNKASGGFTVTVQDKTAPVIAQLDNMSVAPSSISGAVVTYTASASDLVDGAVVPTCTPASGSTFGFGSTKVTCSAKDAAGNSATPMIFTVTVSNLVKLGFYQPVDANGVVNTVKGGSTVPLKFEVFLSANGTEVTDVAVVKSFSVTKVSCTDGAIMDEIEVLTSGSTALRYDATGGQFIQNWKTPTGSSCYKVTVTLVDGQTIAANFKTR